MVEGLAEEGGPVFEADVEHPAVDEVEASAAAAGGRIGRGKLVGPFCFDVVDLELTVGGDPTGLNRREVYAGDGCGGVVVCEFDRPNSGAGAEVEDGVDGGGKGGEIEGTVEREAPELMLEV